MILALIYIAFACLITFSECIRRKWVLVDFLSIFNAFFVFTYLLPSSVFLLFPGELTAWRFLSLYPAAAQSSLVFVAVATGYMALALGFQWGGAYRVDAYPLVAFKYGERTQAFALAVFGATSVLAFALYAHGHGGVTELMLSGKDIRTQRQHAGALQYFGYFASGLTLSTLLLFSFARRSRIPAVRRWTRVLFIVTLVAAVAFAIGTAGRGNIGLVFLFIVVTWINLDRRGLTPAKCAGLSLFGVFLFVLVVYGKSAIWTLGALSDGPVAYAEAFMVHWGWYGGAGSGDGFRSLAIEFLRNIDHAVVSLHLALTNPEIYQSPRLFLDWPRAIVEIIPGVTQPEFVVSHTPSGLNRDFLGVDGYVPPGWMAMKVINGGYTWLVAGSMVAGFVGGYLNRLLATSWQASPMMPGFFVFAGFFWKDYLVGPDPFMVVMPNLPTLFFAICLAWMLTLRFRRRPHASEILV